jgi:cytochrome c oxidase assembly protein subunit 15
LLVRACVLIAVTAAQGLIGLVQYATGVPEALVVAHVLGATLLTAAAANVVLATRTRGSHLTLPTTGDAVTAGL